MDVVVISSCKIFSGEAETACSSTVFVASCCIHKNDDILTHGTWLLVLFLIPEFAGVWSIDVALPGTFGRLSYTASSQQVTLRPNFIKVLPFQQLALNVKKVVVGGLFFLNLVIRGGKKKHRSGWSCWCTWGSRYSFFVVYFLFYFKTFLPQEEDTGTGSSGKIFPLTQNCALWCP